MKVIATMHALLPKDELCKKIDDLICDKIIDYRFNMAKVFDGIEDFDEVIAKLVWIKKRYPNIRLMLDIPYPGQKMRINQEDKYKEIKKGDEYLVVFSEKGITTSDEKIISIYGCLQQGKNNIDEMLYYDMGQGGFKVVSVISNDTLRVIAQNDFFMYNKKSISCGKIIKNDYDSYIEQICDRIVVDEIAFSFIEEAKELETANFLKNKYGFKVVSKIETQKGIENLADIVKSTDVVMLGRGDLCLNADYTLLLEYQKKVCKVCKMQNKEIYFATGYLESLEKNIMPTRSEIIDLLVAVSLHPDGLIFNAATVASPNMKNALFFIQKALGRE